MSQATPRVAIVTGAARGIGAAVARRLASDGFAIGAIDLDAASCAAVVDEIRTAGGVAQALGVDVSDEDAVIAGVDSIARDLGAPAVLVNNAGIIRDNALFRMTSSDWDSVIGVHLRGAFLMSRAAQAHMTQAGWGRIVNMSSVSALGNRGQANYAAAKAGLQGFTKTLAIELGRFGITANCIAPGYIETDMLRQTASRMGISYEEFAEKLLPDVPVGRLGHADDIAAAVSFFARDEASFVTGQVLYVGGGPFA
jgi:3-oxoacyl-[acyl-carrier protein] reductase